MYTGCIMNYVYCMHYKLYVYCMYYELYGNLYCVYAPVTQEQNYNKKKKPHNKINGIRSTHTIDSLCREA